MEHEFYSLKHHQEALVRKCIHHEHTNLNFTNETYSIKSSISFLIDEVGSGKSFVLLEMSKYNIDNTCFEYDTDVCADGNIKICKKTEYHNISTNIIVIPNRLSEQWLSYCKTYKNNIDTRFDYVMIDTTTKLNEIINGNKNMDNYRVVVVTARLYNKLAEVMIQRMVRVCRLIFDQVNDLSIARIKQLQYRHLWLVSDNTHFFVDGKCDGIRLFKSKGFLRDIVNDIMKHKLDVNFHSNLIVENNHKLVKKCMNVQEPIIKEVKCLTPKYITLLNGVVDDGIIHYLNTGNIKQALELINPKLKKTEDNVIKVIVKDSTDSIDVINQQINMINNMDFISETERVSRIHNLTLKQDKYVKIKNHIIHRIKSTNLCNICFCAIENKTVLKCCSNSFCFECINKWFHVSSICPICKHIVNKEKEQFIVMKCNTDESYNLQENSDVIHMHVSEMNDKLENMIVLICASNDVDRFLIYVTGDEIRFKIQNTLKNANILFKKLSGTSRHIVKTINEYNANKIKVLLFDEKHNTTGLNLEFTSDIILFNRVDDILERQIIGCANRIGRMVSEPLRLWLLLNSIDMN